jgi:hypothetical protein
MTGGAPALRDGLREALPDPLKVCRNEHPTETSLALEERLTPPDP